MKAQGLIHEVSLSN